MNQYHKSNLFSKYAIVLIMIVFVCVSFFNKKWQHREIIQFDVYSYYTYLPAVFIFHDLSLGFTDSVSRETGIYFWAEKLENGNKFLKMTSGLAILWSPFFLIANANRNSNIENVYGFGWKYQLAIAISALCYFLLGLYYLRKLLLQYFSDLTSAIVLLLITFGTNLFYYTCYESGMSHVYSFSLISMFLYFSVKWNSNNFSIKYSILIGLLIGFITLIRPINLIIALFPILILYGNIDFLQKLRLIIKRIYIVPIVIIAAFIPFIPQIIYWKAICGSFLFYSYGQEYFFLNKPHVIEGLFGFRKGFFIYTPIMMLIIPGLLLALNKNKNFFFTFILITIPFIYFTFSWWCWWYGGTFGSRSVIDFYALFAIPIGYFISFLLKYKYVMWASFTLFGFLIFLNIFQIYQFNIKLLHYDAMTFKEYKLIFLKNKYPPDYEKYLDHPNIEKAKRFGEL